jgi:hypothetical protein
MMGRVFGLLFSDFSIRKVISNGSSSKVWGFGQIKEFLVLATFLLSDDIYSVTY